MLGKIRRLATRPTLGLLLTILAMAGVAAGCGDDDDSTETISKQEYVQRVEERCAEYQHERNAASKQLQSLGNPSKLTPQQLKDASGDIVALSDVTRQVISDLEEIPRPESEAAELDEVFAAGDEAVAALDDVDEAALAGDVQALTAAFKAEGSAIETVNEAGADFGINSCG